MSVPPTSVMITNISVGDIVSFSYDNASRRLLPVNPKIYKIRTDVSWEDVVSNYNEERRYLTGMNHKHRLV